MIARHTQVMALSVLLLMAASGTTTAQAFRPVAEVRTLVRSQDALTVGRRGSVGLQRTLIGRISRGFRRLPVKTWSSGRNAIAAIKYLMSGGDPTFAENDAVVAAFPERLKPLLMASLSYAQGEAGEARYLFAKIDPRETDPALAGHVALIKSLLTFGSDKEAAMAFLDDARLLGAGTLVEEAAIRRQLGVVVNRHNVGRFQQLSMRYVRKFQRSVYSAAFREHLARGLVDKSFKLDEARNLWLNALLDNLDRSVRPDYCMVIAERGLIQGRTKLVKMTVARVKKDADARSRYGRRAKLFNAAVSIVDAEADEAFEDLESLSDFTPGSFEDNLRQAALAMAKGIAMPVDETKSVAGKAATKTEETKDDALAGSRTAALAALRDADIWLAK
ncbi:MAG: hypothetical protein ACR2PI_17855 [Hyphomicrobiaceae bacterium]